jgi:hypothetical protein
MNEALSFWLENRNCAGTRSAVIGDQVLVLYRDRYYVVTGGVAQTKGGKPLRFSASSLPTAWKRAQKGDVQSPVASATGIEAVPTTRPPKREIKRAEKPAMPEPQQETAAEKGGKTVPPIARAPRRTEAKAAIQPPVVANCPYCNARHEIPLEKGKNGKPFFMPCSKCKHEFAVRLVQVTMYQAQVAGFR